MSLPKKMTVRCSKCGAEIDVTVFESVNTDYAPDITDQIISGELFDAKCDKCGFVSHLEYDILYHDIKHSALIWVLHDNSPEYADYVAELRSSAGVFGYKITRIVNNMNELRQKVACLENGRDDRIIELCKVFTTYNLLSKQPDFDFENAFYTNFLDQERIFLYDKDGQELSCELPDDTYSLLSSIYYNSEYASEFQDYYALVDYDWAENILHPLLKREVEKIDAKTAAKSTPASKPAVTEKKVVCPQCKQPLPEDSAFCHYCGTAIPKDHPPAKSAPPKAIPSSNSATANDITPVALHSRSSVNDKPHTPAATPILFCWQCGSKLTENSAFCSQCGAKAPTVKTVYLNTNDTSYLDNVSKVFPNVNASTSQPTHKVTPARKLKINKTLLVVGIVVLTLIALITVAFTIKRNVTLDNQYKDLRQAMRFVDGLNYSFIGPKIEKFPLDYRDINSIKTEYHQIKKNIEIINSITPCDSHLQTITEKSCTALRNAYTTLIEFDINNANWNLSKYLNDVGDEYLLNLVFGLNWKSSDGISFYWHEGDNNETWLITDLPNNQVYSEDYFYYISSPDKFGYENQNDSNDKFLSYRILDVTYSNRKWQLTIFCYSNDHIRSLYWS